MADSLSELARRLLPFIRRSIGCRVISTATQAIADSTLTALIFNTEISDTGGCWTSGSSTRLTAPVAGYYIAGGGFVFTDANNTVASRLRIVLRANGSIYLATQDLFTVVDKFYSMTITSGRYWLEVGEYIEVMIYHEQGGIRTLSAGSTTNQHYRNGWLQLVD